jgi:hypothetical protein
MPVEGRTRWSCANGSRGEFRSWKLTGWLYDSGAGGGTSRTAPSSAESGDAGLGPLGSTRPWHGAEAVYRNRRPPKTLTGSSRGPPALATGSYGTITPGIAGGSFAFTTSVVDSNSMQSDWQRPGPPPRRRCTAATSPLGIERTVPNTLFPARFAGTPSLARFNGWCRIRESTPSRHGRSSRRWDRPSPALCPRGQSGSAGRSL